MSLHLSCVRLEDRIAHGVAVVKFALCMGFNAQASWEIGIAAQELVSNVIRHAGGGRLELRANGRALELVATDRGPGIPQAVLAAKSEWPRGLGAVHRLMHEIEIESAGAGTRVCARRYLRRGT